MGEKHSTRAVISDNTSPKDEPQTESGHNHVGSGMTKSMHDGVEVWCDCCSCEAEPYWIEAMQNHDDSADNGKT